MQEKSTDDLKQELMEQANLDQYITENEAYFVETDLTETLTELYEKCGLSKAELARRAVMGAVLLLSLTTGIGTIWLLAGGALLGWLLAGRNAS